MISINFDNIYLLFIAIPLLAAVIIPFAIAIRRDNRNASVITTLALHLVIVALITLAAAGMGVTKVITETEVYVVADVSYSANKNLDNIDSYISEIEEDLPRNSSIGIVAFGKDYELLSPIGNELRSVKDSNVDASATDIAKALEYTASLFKKDTIKIIILITDGKQTDGNALAVSKVIDDIEASDIRLDAIYIDDNITEDMSEVQISSVDYTPATYLNHQSEADVIIQSNQATQAIITLQRGDDITNKAVNLNKGFNEVIFDLDTTLSGVYDYSVTITADKDTSLKNNTYLFTQTVAGKVKVLLISSKKADLDSAKALYGEDAEIVSYINDPAVPCTVEELASFDEIILSNIDVRSLNNYISFVKSLDIAVSSFGKSLVTMGDLQIQNKTDEVLLELAKMLPVSYGNDDQEARLLGIVIDMSRSMENLSRFAMAKYAAIKLIDLLNDDDWVTVVAFAGDVYPVIQPMKVGLNRVNIQESINALQPEQGTFLGAGLNQALTSMKPLNFEDKQIMLISDGMPYMEEEHDPYVEAENLWANGISISAINTNNDNTSHTENTHLGVAMLKRIAEIGHGSYYFASSEEDMEDLLLTDVADEMRETVVEENSEVNIKLRFDDVMENITALPNVNGYLYSKTKGSASTVLTVDYVKPSGATVEAPLYANWKYGNGKVSTFTSAISGNWVSAWTSGSGATFFSNVLKVNTPDECKSYPYTLNVEVDGVKADVEIIPAVVSGNVKAEVAVKLPTGEVLDKEVMTFDSTRHHYSFVTPMVGKYELAFTYTYGTLVFESTSIFTISYPNEYDSFLTYDVSELNKVVRNKGSVYRQWEYEFSTNDEEVETYSYSLVIPLAIAGVVLYVIDVIIRRLKWADIKALFKKSTKGAKK